MLGDRIEDEVESRAAASTGLGLLPVNTTLRAREAAAPASRGTRAGRRRPTGYEIRHGRVDTAASRCIDDDEPATSLGTSWHGLLEGDDVRRALLRWVAERARPRAGRPGTTRVRRRARGAPRPSRRLVRRPRRRRPRSPTSSQHGAPEGLPDHPARRRCVLRLLTTADTEILAAAHARRGSSATTSPRSAARTRARSTDARPRSLDGARRRRRPPARRAPRVAGGRRPAAQRCCEQRRHRADPARRRGRARRRARRALARARRAPSRRPFEYLRHGGVDNTRELLRFLGRHVRARRATASRRRSRSRTSASTPAGNAASARRPPARRRRLLPLALRHRQHGVRRRAGAAIEDGRRPGRPASGPTRLARRRRPALKLLDGEVDALITTVLASGGSHARRRVARRGARGARRPGHPGAVRDHVARSAGRSRTPASPRSTPRCRSRSPSSTAASSASRSPSRSRSPTRRSRRCTTRPTSSAAPASRGSRSTTRGCARWTAREQRTGDRAQLLPDQARADRQRGRPRHARQRDGAAGRRCRTPATGSSTTSPTATSSSTR